MCVSGVEVEVARWARLVGLVGEGVTVWLASGHLDA
jgi:hypothetical protein